jgi:hypothetical protein
MGKRIAHEMNATALLTCVEHPGNRRLDPLVSIGDCQLDAAQPAARELAQESSPPLAIHADRNNHGD